MKPLLTKLTIAIAALALVALTGCVSAPDLIREAAKDPAKVHLEFTGWNAHFVYDRDNSGVNAAKPTP